MTTRAQKAAQQLQLQEDDIASATSGASPTDLFLDDIDDSIYATPSKQKQKLSRSQKREKAARRFLSSMLPTSIAEFTPQQLAEAQEEDGSLEDL